MYISKSAPLSAISSARSTAMIVDSGHGYTYFAPVHDGYVLDKAMLKYPVGGSMISEAIETFLKSERGVTIHSEFEVKKDFPYSKII